ncbi:hypothetical protein ZWY2020_007192 [Hordeum vulgare]|nr:hypothetical protein ZWY2020_014155 [Hordeum vulgare]KAI4992879.1 hypothetical protein ZWY2020_007192 [Hordeum vulgare]
MTDEKTEPLMASTGVIGQKCKLLINRLAHWISSETTKFTGFKQLSTRDCSQWPPRFKSFHFTGSKPQR